MHVCLGVTMMHGMMRVKGWWPKQQDRRKKKRIVGDDVGIECFEEVLEFVQLVQGFCD